MNVKEVEFHPGHWKLLSSGANGILNEVTEARKVTKRVYDILRSWKVPATYFEDNTSTNQTQNINTLIKEHNKDKDGLIVSIHFNAGGDGSKAIGTEVLYYDQKNLASKIAKAISDATGGGLLNRGAKQRTDLGVLARTYEPAILIEVCFVNSVIDAAIYRRDFEKICQAIAKELAAYIGYTPNNNTSNKEELSVSAEAKLQKQIDELKKEVKGKVDIQSNANVESSHKEAWEWAIDEGIIKGDGTSFNPAGVLTRQQMATMLKRYHDKHVAR